jgi:hypothetical protein
VRGEVAWLAVAAGVLVVEYLAPEDQLLTDAAHRHPLVTAAVTAALAYHLVASRHPKMKPYDPLRPLAAITVARRRHR